MKIIEQERKNYKPFETLGLGQLFRLPNGKVYIKIADCYNIDTIENCLEADGELVCIDDLVDSYDPYNAFSLDYHALTIINDWTDVEPIDCELHIV